MILETPAFYLKHRPHGQESAIVHLFCREPGPLTVYQKGFCSPKFRWKALFDFGQELYLSLRESGDNYFLADARLLQSIPLRDYRALTIGSFLFQLLSAWPVSVPWNAPSLYDAVRQELHFFSTAIEWPRLLQLQLWILQEFGLLGDHAECFQCQTRFGPEAFSFAEPGEWSFLCADCRLRHPSPGTSALRLDTHERDILSSWFAPVASKRGELSGTSLLALQNHLNTLYRDWVPFKMTQEVMRVLTEF